MRAYCKNQTFLLVALDGSQMKTRPNDFNDIPDKFTADPTFKMAVAAGALEPFETAKRGVGAKFSEVGTDIFAEGENGLDGIGNSGKPAVGEAIEKKARGGKGKQAVDEKTDGGKGKDDAQ